ncbi:hypothetical protein D9619_003890 [Psilocybe cf. subviscida]|uniref:Uncharacterized protein n=1 Tax=Psilocybe cf. subviscida TaxID=2480587 RepID=A0A8H5F888_9AGAR|nr:hypothetical protein D9619_003890 [Psilocybe cf. subviscida]
MPEGKFIPELAIDNNDEVYGPLPQVPSPTNAQQPLDGRSFEGIGYRLLEVVRGFFGYAFSWVISDASAGTIENASSGARRRRAGDTVLDDDELHHGIQALMQHDSSTSGTLNLHTPECRYSFAGLGPYPLNGSTAGGHESLPAYNAPDINPLFGPAVSEAPGLRVPTHSSPFGQQGLISNGDDGHEAASQERLWFVPEALGLFLLCVLYFDILRHVFSFIHLTRK